MPNITLSLTDGELADLQSISEERKDDSPEATGHDLLVSAINREMQSSPTARQRSFSRGVTSARGAAAFSDAVVRSLKVQNLPSYPPHLRRQL